MIISGDKLGFSPSHPRISTVTPLSHLAELCNSIQRRAAIHTAMTSPLLPATPDIVSLSSQAEFLLPWLMPARAGIQQQRKILPPLPRDFPREGIGRERAQNWLHTAAY